MGRAHFRAKFGLFTLCFSIVDTPFFARKLGLKTTNDSYRVDETYIKVKGEWKYLYRAVDSEGNTIDFLLCAKRDERAAERFFRKALRAVHTTQPRGMCCKNSG
jgi:transposase-like protein